MCEKSPFISVRKVSTISSLDSFRGARRATMVSWHFGFFFCVANILKCIWTFREHLFLLPLSLLTSGRLRLGWPHFWSEDFLSDPSPIIALSCHWVTHSLNALVEFCSNWICQSCYTLLFSKLLDRFVKIVTGISLSCYMDLSKLIHTCYLDLLKLLHGFLTALAALYLHI